MCSTGRVRLRRWQLPMTSRLRRFRSPSRQPLSTTWRRAITRARLRFVQGAPIHFPKTRFWSKVRHRRARRPSTRKPLQPSRTCSRNSVSMRRLLALLAAHPSPATRSNLRRASRLNASPHCHATSNTRSPRTKSRSSRRSPESRRLVSRFPTPTAISSPSAMFCVHPRPSPPAIRCRLASGKTSRDNSSLPTSPRCPTFSSRVQPALVSRRSSTR